MVRFDNITTDLFISACFDISKGAVCKIVAESDFARSLIFNTILGFKKPKHGSVYLFNKNVLTISRNDAIALFKNIGVIWRYGGLVSNLSVWDNIVLPALYHKRVESDNVLKEIVIDFFNQVGFNILESGYLKRSCGTLPIHERRLISIIRSIIMEPDLVIYDSVFEGYEEGINNSLVHLLQEFHKKSAERTSIFLYSRSEEQSGNGVKTDIVIRQTGKKIIVE